MKRYKFSLQYPKPLADNELAPLIEVAKSGLFSRYTSDYVKEVEKEIASYYQTQHAVTCTSGTAALHGCLTALDFEPGSEIIVTPVADIGVVLPIIYENLIPVFADIDPETYNISIESVQKLITNKTRAIIAVHLAGSPADLDGFQALCEQRNIVLLEDFSQAHGAKWHEKKVGSIGLMGYASFQQSKQITCGEGGVIVTDDPDLAYRALIGVDKGWQRERPLEDRLYEFLAPNVRFNALQAAVLQPQLRRLDTLIDKKRALADILYNALSDCHDHVVPQRILDGGYHSYYSFPLYVKHDQAYRDKLVRTMDQDFQVRCAYGYANPVPLYMCVNALSDPKKYGKGLNYASRDYPPGLCPNAEKLLTKSFLLPFNENFSEEDMTEIATRLKKSIRKLS